MNIMRAIYRTTLMLITSFCFMLGAIQTTKAQDIIAEHTTVNMFEIRDIAIDVTADNAVQARQQAMTKAQNQAWNILIQRLSAAGENMEALAVQDDLTISALVETVSVSNEQLAPTRYIADISVQFNEQAVRNFAARQGNRLHIQEQAQPILILPWFTDLRGKTFLWGDDNAWAAQWAQQSGQTVPPIRVPLGDIMDIRDFAPESPLSYNDLKLQSLLDRYGLDQAVIAFAQMQTPERLQLTLYDTESGIPIETTNQTIAVDPVTSAQDANALMKNAIETALLYMRGNNIPLLTTQKHDYRIIVKTRNLQDWIGIKKRLNQSLSADGLKIDRLTPAEIRITISYAGDIIELRQQLAVYGLILSESVSNYGQDALYILSDMSSTPSGFTVERNGL